MTTAFHRRRITVPQPQPKKIDFKAKLEDSKKAEGKKAEEKKPVEVKPTLTIKIDSPQSNEKKSDDVNDSGSSRSGMGMGVLMMSKRKSKDWLRVPVKTKPKAPLFPEKQEEIIEEEEISDDPVVIKGARVNLLGYLRIHFSHDCITLIFFRCKSCRGYEKGSREGL